MEEKETPFCYLESTHCLSAPTCPDNLAFMMSKQVVVHRPSVSETKEAPNEN